MSTEDESQKKKDLTGLSELNDFGSLDSMQETLPESLPLSDFPLSSESADDSPESFELPEIPHSEPLKADSPEEAVQDNGQTILPPSPSASTQALQAEAEQEASLPFNLRIIGKLTIQEREKICDILSREKMGIREVDLEPQFMARKILIPRISEYAGVVLVQALRGTTAAMELLPTDQDERGTEASGAFETTFENLNETENDAALTPHSAELIPLTPDSVLAGFPNFRVIDLITASATLESQSVDARNSTAYQEMVESLQRELRYKAFYKGANAVVNFSIQLQSLSLPTRYRLLVMGSAIKTN